MTTLSPACKIEAATLRDNVNSLKQSLRSEEAPILLLGPEAITVTHTSDTGEQRDLPFYRLVAESLLSEYGLPTDKLYPPDHRWDLHVAYMLVQQETKLSAAVIRKRISRLINDLYPQVKPSGALEALTKLTCFDQIVCLTPDNLFERAVRDAQPGLEINVSSSSPSRSTADQDSAGSPTSGTLHLNYLLGQHPVDSDYAVHEEDALEYLFKLAERNVRDPSGVLALLRKRDRIFLGVNLPDWLGRSLMRYVDNDRLTAEERKNDYVSMPTCEAALVGFVQRFSLTTCLLPWTPAEFVTHIAETTEQLDPRIGYGPQSWMSGPATAHRGQPVKIFISYASEDLAAAEKIAESLCRLGFDKVWFDKKALQPGDKWKQVIVAAINQCDYFVPVLSKKTWDPDKDKREFRYEWRMGVKRDRQIGNQRAFLIPIDIENSEEETLPRAMPKVAYYDPQAPHPNQLPPEPEGVNQAFNSIHLIRAKGGHLSEGHRDALQKLAQDIRASRAGAARG